MSLDKKESCDYESVKESIREEIISQINMCTGVEDKALFDLIDNEILLKSGTKYIPLGMKMKLRNDLYNSFRGLDILQELVEDKEVTEIMVNAYDKIFVERGGKISRWNGRFTSEEKYNDVIQSIVSKVNRVVNESNPIADARLADGSRVNIVLNPVAIDGSVLTIRKFPEKVLTMEELVKKGTLTSEVADFLKILVRSKYNILLSGGTSSGKTTMLNALAGFIPDSERIITIEDSAELQINNIPNIVRMEVKNANMEGNREVTIRDLIKSSLRMRPDRIIVGEVRDSAAIDLLSAYNTGHDGSISTAHSNSAADMLLRMETMVLMGGGAIPISAIRRQIASAIDIIVHVARLRDGSRKVVEISEVVGTDGESIALNMLYQFVEKADKMQQEYIRGEFVRGDNTLMHKEKLISSGNYWRYMEIFEQEKLC